MTRQAAADTGLDEAEVGYFDALADDWWAPRGPFAALQRMNPARVEYIRRQAARCLGQAYGNRLAGLTVLDIGCGGGLLAEPLARLGARVTGVDAGAGAVAAARAHAAAAGLGIDYHAGPAGDLAGNTYDIVIASEVVEHVSDRPAFLRMMAGFGHPARPGRPSLAVLTTINRSVAGVALGKFAAEYLLRLAPRGAHDPRRFVRPRELRDEALGAGIAIDDITGIRPSLIEGFRLGGPPLVNYAAAGLIVPQGAKAGKGRPRARARGGRPRP